MINATAPRSITLEHSVLEQREAQFEVVDAAGLPSRPGRSTLGVIADRVRLMGLALLGVCRLSGNPRYFELDRRTRTAIHLGADLTWESDSFWPSSYPCA
jgi:hypothetical protein